MSNISSLNPVQRFCNNSLKNLSHKARNAYGLDTMGFFEISEMLSRSQTLS